MENYILSPDDSFNLYKLLNRVVKILEKNNIKYWASGGTFLGAIRSKGIIKWDDDLDLCVLDYDKEKLKKLISEEKDLIFDDFSTFVNKIRYKKDNYPFVDIFYGS
jgi:phosphorylcholine metabolism protein LicD